MAAAIAAPVDLRSLELWARHLHTSVGALRSWCYRAGVPPRRSLVLARVLRAVRLARASGDRPEEFLDFADARTGGKLLRLAGIVGEEPVDMSTILQRQSLVRNLHAVEELERVLAG